MSTMVDYTSIQSMMMSVSEESILATALLVLRRATTSDQTSGSFFSYRYIIALDRGRHRRRCLLIHNTR